ncbi:MAG: MFS transporter [Actinomycetota bacterium]|nr:MFS transporter [Actinomycetota bacterium]MDQ2955988.1 MFS transporter [Actinomycetota bacterium]
MAGAEQAAERLGECPGFLRFWNASTVSGFGTYITTLAIQVLVVLTLHEGAAGVGLVSAARWLPYLLFGLVAGVLADRSRRRPLLVTTDLGRGLLLIAIPLLALTHRLTIVVLLAFMLAFGLLSLVNDAASRSFLPRLVPAGLLTPAHARLDQSDALAQTSGPALAGGLVSLLTAVWAVLVDAASYLISGLLLLRMPVVEPASRPLSLRGIKGEAAEGLRWVYRHRTLRPYALGTHGWFLCSAAANAILPPFALRTLHLNAFGFGLILAAGGVGGLLGSLVATRLGTLFGVGRVVIACTVGIALAWGMVALSFDHWAGWLLCGAGELVLGISMGAENANEMGYLQSVTPDDLQGRTHATMRSINRAMIVIGAPLGGLLGDAIGFRAMLWIAAAGFLLVAITFALSPYRNARLDELPVPGE